MDPATALPLAFGRAAPKAKAPQHPTADHASDGRAVTSMNGQSSVASSSRALPGVAVSDVGRNSPARERKPNNQEYNSQNEDEHQEEHDDEDDGLQRAAEPTRDLPVSHQAVMKDHSKAVSCISLDPSGSRLVSGSYDYDCKLWDFGGMNSALKPFRSWEPKENHQVHSVQFSPSGNQILVATGSNQAKLYDRNGVEVAEFAKGDPYIRDLRNTDGHVAALTSVAWNQKNSSLFLTASEDSCLRIWDVTNKRKSKSTIAVKSKDRGGRAKVTCCAWSVDGKTIGGACQDGSIHLWSASSNFARPNASAEGAHKHGVPISGIAFSSDGRQLASRSMDGTVKLWDPRSFKKPLHVAGGIPSLNPETNVAFSPDERYILTGSAGSHAGVLEGQADAEKLRENASAEVADGQLVILRRDGLSVHAKIGISSASVVAVHWHPKINQIVTGSSDGTVHVLYSPETSLKGVTNALSRAPRVRQADFLAASSAQGPIIAPHSLPMYREDDSSTRPIGGKRKRDRERHDPQKTLKPMPPVTGPGRGGRIGAAATQHVVQGLVRNHMRDQDPREALLKYATEDASDNKWTAAWSKTQPKPVFAEELEETENDKKS
ncbi:hypothetical protein ACM66B_004608 [Microbotryomycetes sp. NB124-2]